MAGLKHPVTPDGRYFVVRGKLWRMANPAIEAHRKSELVRALMQARRAVKGAKSCGDRVAEDEAHRAVDAAKQALGERGPAWWSDGAPDFNRHAVKNTPYADWYCTCRTGISASPERRAPPAGHHASRVGRGQPKA